jgi:LDH2 family malate/lactate/ureidoglycolate dehydrogenase
MDQARAVERVPAPAISGLIADALATVGLHAADAAKVAELMTEADLTGADAHGVFRLPQYVRRLRAGGVSPASTRSGCRACSAATAARTGCATACRCCRNCWRSSTSWRTSWA